MMNNEEMNNRMAKVEAACDAGLKASGIKWAAAKIWEKEVQPGRFVRRIYFNVGRQSAGYIEVAEDGSLSIPHHGNGTVFNRPALVPVAERVVGSL